MLKYGFVRHYNLSLLNPPVDYWIKKIDNFSYCKLNHAFWQMYFQDGSRWEKIFLDLHGEKFINEFKESMYLLNSISLGVSLDGPPGVTLAHSPWDMSSRIKELFSSNLYYGSIWKQYVLNHSIIEFVNCIKNKKIIVVGLKHLCNINYYLKFKQFTFLDVPINASDHRYEILNNIKSIGEDGVILLQCGEMFSAWLVLQLKDLRAVKIDMGRALDVFAQKDIERYVPEDCAFFADIKNQRWLSQFNLDDFLEKFK